MIQNNFHHNKLFDKIIAIVVLFIFEFRPMMFFTALPITLNEMISPKTPISWALFQMGDVALIYTIFPIIAYGTMILILIGADQYFLGRMIIFQGLILGILYPFIFSFSNAVFRVLGGYLIPETLGLTLYFFINWFFMISILFIMIKRHQQLDNGKLAASKELDLWISNSWIIVPAIFFGSLIPVQLGYRLISFPVIDSIIIDVIFFIICYITIGKRSTNTFENPVFSIYSFFSSYFLLIGIRSIDQAEIILPFIVNIFAFLILYKVYQKEQ